jgi:hypothetical protein
VGDGTIDALFDGAIEATEEDVNAPSLPRR